MPGTSDADIAPLIERALDAIDADESTVAAELVEQIASALDPADAQRLHVEGMLAWASGDIEGAASKLTAAVDADADQARIYFDCAELMLSTGLDLDVAEASLRTILGREGLDPSRADLGKILLAQVCLEQPDPDAEEALELLESVGSEGKSEVFWTSTKAAALLDLGRSDDAIHLLESASASPEAAGDPDVHYQLGVCYALAGRGEQAVKAMICASASRRCSRAFRSLS
jgi:tetratricopeptide (TPR) repeat protein